MPLRLIVAIALPLAAVAQEPNDPGWSGSAAGVFGGGSSKVRAGGSGEWGEGGLMCGVLGSNWRSNIYIRISESGLRCAPSGLYQPTGQ